MSRWRRGRDGRRLCYTAALLLLVLAAPGGALASARVHGQGLLWRIEALGYKTGYLFGTMHVTDERVLRVPEPVLRAFDASRQCLFELIVPDDGFTGTINGMMLPEGIYLRDIVGDDAYDKIVVTAGRYKIPTAQIGRMHPAAVLFAFRLPPNEWLRRMAGWAFLDLALENEARALGKPIYPLETFAEQMAAIGAELRPTELSTILNGMLEDSFRRDQEFETRLQYYLRRDMDAWFGAEEAAMRLLPEAARQAQLRLRKRMLDDRNKVMVERMLPYLRKASSFVAIGAAHLSGRQGVLRLLELRGFRVSRIY